MHLARLRRTISSTNGGVSLSLFDLTGRIVENGPKIAVMANDTDALKLSRMIQLY
jgi:hypothetical protein